MYSLALFVRSVVSHIEVNMQDVCKIVDKVN